MKGTLLAAVVLASITLPALADEITISADRIVSLTDSNISRCEGRVVARIRSLERANVLSNAIRTQADGSRLLEGNVRIAVKGQTISTDRAVLRQIGDEWQVEMDRADVTG